jgi:hypothetical protein
VKFSLVQLEVRSLLGDVQGLISGGVGVGVGGERKDTKLWVVFLEVGDPRHETRTLDKIHFVKNQHHGFLEFLNHPCVECRWEVEQRVASICAQ